MQKKKLPTKLDLREAYEKALDIHKNHLSGENVKMPSRNSAKGYWLSILIYYSPDSVHKDTISDIVREYKPELGRDQQVRHLKSDGWNLESDGRGVHCIKNPFSAHPGYSREIIKKQNLLLASDFEDIKKAFSNRCATCGARENEPDPRYGSEKVKLERGHRDPEKSLDSNNVIPQCQFCNKAYKSDFTFDKRGRVRSVASINPIKRASDLVQNDIKKYLLGKYSHKKNKL